MRICIRKEEFITLIVEYSYIEMMIVSSFSTFWWYWLIFAETEVTAATTTATTITSRCDATNQEQCLKQKCLEIEFY